MRSVSYKRQPFPTGSYPPSRLAAFQNQPEFTGGGGDSRRARHRRLLGGGPLLGQPPLAANIRNNRPPPASVWHLDESRPHHRSIYAYVAGCRPGRRNSRHSGSETPQDALSTEIAASAVSARALRSQIRAAIAHNLTIPLWMSFWLQAFASSRAMRRCPVETAMRMQSLSAGSRITPLGSLPS